MPKQNVYVKLKELFFSPVWLRNSFLIHALLLFFFLQISRYALQLSEAMQSLSWELIAQSQSESLVQTKPNQTKNHHNSKTKPKRPRAKIACEPFPQKGSGKDGKMYDRRKEEEQNNPLITKYWTNHPQ